MKFLFTNPPTPDEKKLLKLAKDTALETLGEDQGLTVSIFKRPVDPKAPNMAIYDVRLGMKGLKAESSFAFSPIPEEVTQNHNEMSFMVAANAKTAALDLKAQLLGLSGDTGTMIGGVFVLGPTLTEHLTDKVAEACCNQLQSAHPNFIGDFEVWATQNPHMGSYWLKARLTNPLAKGPDDFTAEIHMHPEDIKQFHVLKMEEAAKMLGERLALKLTEAAKTPVAKVSPLTALLAKMKETPGSMKMVNLPKDYGSMFKLPAFEGTYTKELKDGVVGWDMAESSKHMGDSLIKHEWLVKMRTLLTAVLAEKLGIPNDGALKDAVALSYSTNIPMAGVDFEASYKLLHGVKKGKTIVAMFHVNKWLLQDAPEAVQQAMASAAYKLANYICEGVLSDGGGSPVLKAYTEATEACMHDAFKHWPGAGWKIAVSSSGPNEVDIRIEMPHSAVILSKLPVLNSVMADDFLVKTQVLSYLAPKLNGLKVLFCGHFSPIPVGATGGETLKLFLPYIRKTMVDYANTLVPDMESPAFTEQIEADEDLTPKIVVTATLYSDDLPDSTLEFSELFPTPTAKQTAAKLAEFRNHILAKLGDWLVQNNLAEAYLAENPPEEPKMPEYFPITDEPPMLPTRAGLVHLIKAASEEFGAMSPEQLAEYILVGLANAQMEQQSKAPTEDLMQEVVLGDQTYVAEYGDLLQGALAPYSVHASKAVMGEATRLALRAHAVLILREYGPQEG